jgi:hypothetical protein
MTTDEWVAAVLATRPPLTQAQLAVLRPIFRPVIPRTHNAAPALTEAAPAITALPERS